MSENQYTLFEPIENEFLVPYNGNFALNVSSTQPSQAISRSVCKPLLKATLRNLSEYQRILYAQKRHALLLVFQGMDAAGKDSTIHAISGSLSPTGCQVFSFKRPTSQEQAHDFLWRTSKCLPERGMIGIFNRSYYEEVIIVRVHPQHLERQGVPYPGAPQLWEHRFESIRDHERHLARNGTIILKFWLNVSREEQLARFEARIRDERKHWKISSSDLQERGYWDQYMQAYEEALRATSRPWAPWYAIPADTKYFTHLAIAEIITATLNQLKLRYPVLGPKRQQEKLNELYNLLRDEQCAYEHVSPLTIN
ncbi:MAG: PPK2 family polyphosphate kinase [Cyanobacteria bacterium P01_H01_bin.121]